MKVPGLRSSYEKVGGIVFFGRMLDKIRLHAQGKLPAGYNLGSGFDGRCVRFLRVDYNALVKRALEGGTDEAVLEWCFQKGRRPIEEEIFIWNTFLAKRGLRDEVSDELRIEKEKRGFAHRDDIQTFFDFHKADESED
jgi:gluconokinase